MRAAASGSLVVPECRSNPATPSGAQTDRGDSGRYERETFVDDVVIAPSERVVVDVLFARPGQLTLEHRTTHRTYPLGVINVAADRAEPSLTGRFEALRVNADLAAARGRISSYVHLEHVRQVVGDSRIELKIGGRFTAEPSSVSSTDSQSFRTLERAIRRVAPDAIVAPYLVVVATDARYYSSFSRHVFRFLPVRLTSGDLQRMHGINERIGIREYEDATRTYRQLVIDAAGNVNR